MKKLIVGTRNGHTEYVDADEVRNEEGYLRAYRDGEMVGSFREETVGYYIVREKKSED